MATPFTAVAVRMPPSVPPAPACSVAVTTVVLSLVRVLPCASRTATIGCVTSAAPEAPPTGACVTASCVAGPGTPVMENVCAPTACRAVTVLSPAVAPIIQPPSAATPDVDVVTDTLVASATSDPSTKALLAGTVSHCDDAGFHAFDPS